MLGGAVFFPATKTKDVLRFCRDFAATIPDELVIQGGAIGLPDAGRVFAIGGCYCGPLSEGEKLLKPLRTFGSPVADIFNVLSYVQMQTLFDAFFPPGRLTYVKSNFMPQLTDDAISAMAEYAGKSPSDYSFAPFFEHWHGAATRVGPTDTAFPHRQYSWNFLAWSMWTDPAESEKNRQWTREC